MADSKELQVKEKQEAASPAEQTRPGVVFTPDVDICENEQQITLLADMPGVTPGDVTIDINDNVLSISGEVKPFEEGNESDVLIEFEIGRYYRQFTLSEMIDQRRIEAKHENGVLRLTLPKAEKAIPRQITVTAG
ncbi:Hsp20/alpha crystallin family protein [Desulfosarcina ovata]|uniref:Heat-shock protein n=1 Tax=Desulfosarcina ovata subsp. ovata TaxID=2752305 RepID=A0A5K8AGH5_9BACT|nr:Hsp20/alpha crystallin family protein [Desulfosarcina ovata]BBO91747.1 heat-shock protein [Desulfosarcina ovata subsp. ovata]